MLDQARRTPARPESDSLPQQFHYTLAISEALGIDRRHRMTRCASYSTEMISKISEGGQPIQLTRAPN